MAVAGVCVALLMIMTGYGQVASFRVTAQSSYTQNTGTGTVVASGSVSCSIDPVNWNIWYKIYDDGTGQKWQGGDYPPGTTSIQFQVNYNLNAPGWADEADMNWAVFKQVSGTWTQLEGPHAISTGGSVSGNQVSASYAFAAQFRVDITVWGYDWGSQTCTHWAQFYVG
jgi:hypothetical protein